MRVLHIISNMRPDSGGPQEAVRMILRSVPEGCMSEVVTLDDPAADFLRTEPFTIHALGGGTKLAPWLRGNRSRFDGMVLHGMWESLSLAVLRTVAGHTPYVVYPHGMLDPYFKRAFPLKHLKKWMYWLPVQYWVMRRALRVVFTTTAERDLAAQSFWLHRWNASVIGLSAEAPPANLEPCLEAFHTLCPAVCERQFLLFLGRIDRKKGCDLLVRAFAEVHAHDREIHLVMAGPDSSGWRNTLIGVAESTGVGDRVHFPGMLKGQAKWGAFAACEAFVLPSHQENFGIAIVEALACAKPVLLTEPINIAADLFQDGSALVEDDTLDGVCRLLTWWDSESKEERVAMSCRAKESVAKRYDMRKNTRVLMDIFATSTKEADAFVEASKA